MKKLIRIFYIILFFAGMWIILGFFHAFLSISRRGEVTQDYWYCDTYMIDKENDIVKKPHHYGHKPIIPFSDHVCGINELNAARSHGWSE